MQYLLLLILAILAIWLFTPATRVPRPRRLEFEDLPKYMIDAVASRLRVIEGLKFKMVDVFDCSSMANQATHVFTFLDESKRVEYAVIAVSAGKDHIFIIDEFCSTLLPHGELNTNNNRHFSPFSEPLDHFQVKMPWVKDLAQLHTHHLAHLEALEQVGFRAACVREGFGGERIVDQFRHTYEIQILRGRSKRTGDDTYKWTLKGATLGVPLILLSVLIPVFHSFVGSRTLTGRTQRLIRQAKKARRLPEQLQMRTKPKYVIF